MKRNSLTFGGVSLTPRVYLTLFHHCYTEKLTPDEVTAMMHRQLSLDTQAILEGAPLTPRESAPEFGHAWGEYVEAIQTLLSTSGLAP
jgi:hypothetical protein